jgi:hypothetical protein
MHAFEHYYGLGEHAQLRARVQPEFSVASSTVKLMGTVVPVGRIAFVSATSRSRVTLLWQNHERRDHRAKSGASRLFTWRWFNLRRAIAEGEMRMTLSDLDKLIRLEAFLSDEPESRHELVLHNLKNKSGSRASRHH